MEKKYKYKGLTGLSNLGNTCFINSCVQILSHTHEINKILFNKENNYNNVDDYELLKEWYSLYTLIWDKNCTIIPNRFIYTIQQISKKKNNNMFTDYSQNDVSEFLLFLIDCFHNSISKKGNIHILGKPQNEKDNLAIKCYDKIKDLYSTNNYSELYELLYGINVTIIKDLSDNIIKTIPEQYFILDLPVHNNTSNIYDCFNLYTSYEELCDDNMWYNEETKKYIKIKKGTFFWHFPDILVITLKRFLKKDTKNNNLINFPLEDLDLSKYVIGYNKNIFKYNLYAVSNHSGGLFGGHYTSYVKKEDKWFEFNDTNINEISKSSIISPNAYCLFYRKI